MSRFVSQGSTEDYKAESNDAWTRAKQEVDALKKKPATPQGVQEGGKSLYEHLQANKEKKQAEFEEAQRLKNQFQALNEDDVDFLDSVLASTRAKEAAVKQDTAEQLAAFRRQQGKPIALGIEQEAPAPAGNTWSKKRRRTKEVDGAASKLVKTASPCEQQSPPQQNDDQAKNRLKDDPGVSKSPVDDGNPVDIDEKTAPVSCLGLGAYESDDD
ncbi:hypothetical protein DV735_g3991, partial [Chaetothyriales sp. CBS 134920]